MNSRAPIIVLIVTGGILIAGMLLALLPTKPTQTLTVIFDPAISQPTTPVAPASEPLFPGLESPH